MQPASFWAHHAHVYVPRPKADQLELSSHEEAGDGGAGGGEAGSGAVGGDGGAKGGEAAVGDRCDAGGGDDAGHVPHVTGQAVVWPYWLL